jgi:hypothetical protein
MTKPKERWRYFVECAHCHENISFADAPSPEDDPEPTHRGVVLECPHCRTEHAYRGSQIMRGAEHVDI